jgi:D-amino-acid dehydrogenase
MRRVIVIGAGIVGLSCAYNLLRAGFSVLVVDRDPTGDKASFGNAGGIAIPEILPASSPGIVWRVPRWLFDPLGPLAIRPSYAPRLLPWMMRFLQAGRADRRSEIAATLSALNALAYDDLSALLNDIGLSADLHRAGALYVYQTKKGLERDRISWEARKSYGVECHPLSGNEARKLEPALDPSVQYAMLTPAWSHVSDPKRMVDVLREWLRSQGVRIEADEALAIAPTCAERALIHLRREGPVTCDLAVVAAGAWSGRLAASLGDRVVLESERGYNATLPKPAIELSREIIFAEHQFVATPMSIGLRIGGAAEFAGLSAPPNYARVSALLKLARKYLPQLSVQGAKPWMGHRPATPDSLPVIGRSPRCWAVLYAFGHGHLGLTQAATTGRLIKQLAVGETPSIDLRAVGVNRFS